MKKYLFVFIMILFFLLFSILYKDSLEINTGMGPENIENPYSKDITKNEVKMKITSDNPRYNNNQPVFITLEIENLSQKPINAQISNCEFISPFLTFDNEIKSQYEFKILSAKNINYDTFSNCVPSQNSYQLLPNQPFELSIELKPKDDSSIKFVSNELHLTGHFNNVSLPFTLNITN